MPGPISKTSPDLMSSGLANLRGAKGKTVELEKERLNKATKEFEAFFKYQMLKTMRKTVPESPFAKNSPMSAGAGKETFTDIFDMEIARKMNNGDSRSISEMLYKSLEKLIESEFEAANSDNIEIRDLQSNEDKFKPMKLEEKPFELDNAPIQIETVSHGPIELMRQNRTTDAQDLSKNPKAP